MNDVVGWVLVILIVAIYFVFMPYIMAPILYVLFMIPTVILFGPYWMYERFGILGYLSIPFAMILLGHNWDKIENLMRRGVEYLLRSAGE